MGYPTGIGVTEAIACSPSRAPSLALIDRQGEVVRLTEAFREGLAAEGAPHVSIWDFITDPDQRSLLSRVLDGELLRADITLAAAAGPVAVDAEAVLDVRFAPHALLTVSSPGPDPDRQTGMDALANNASLDESAAIVWITDLGGRFLRVNQRYSERLGIDDLSIRGKTDAELSPAHIVDGRRLPRHQGDGEEPVQLEYTVEAFGERPALTVLRFPVRDLEGAPIAICRVAAPIPEAAIARSEGERLLRTERWARLGDAAIRAEVLDEWKLSKLVAEPVIAPEPAVRPMLDAADTADTADTADAAAVLAQLAPLREELAAERGVNAELERSLWAERAAKAELERSHEAERAAMAELGRTVGEERAANVELETSLDRALAAKVELETSLRQARGANAELDRSLEAERAAKAELERSVGEERERVAGLQAAGAAADRRVEELVRAGAAARGQIATLEAALTSERGRVEELERARTKTSSEADRAGALNDARAELEQHLADARRRAEEAERTCAAEREAAAQAVAELIARAEQAEAATNQMQAEREQATVASERAQAAATRARAAAEAEGREALERARAEIAALRFGLAQAQVELETARAGTVDADEQLDQELRKPAAPTSGPAWSHDAQRALTVSVAGASEWRTGLKDALRILGSEGGWDVVVAWCPDEPVKALRCAAMWTSGSSQLGLFETATWQRRPLLATSEVGVVAGSGRSAWLVDLTSARDAQIAAAASAGMRAALLVPITHGGVTIGVLELLTRAASPPDPGLIAATEAVALQLAHFDYLLRRGAEPRWKLGRM